METAILVIFALLMALTPAHTDTETRDKRAGRMLILAHAMAVVSKSREESAWLLTDGWAESRFAQTVHAGKRRPGTCDWDPKTQTFRARSPWQLWNNETLAKDWDTISGVSPVSTLLAAQHAVAVKRRCRRADYSFAALDGDGCRQTPMGDARFVMMQQALAAMATVRPAVVSGKLHALPFDEFKRMYVPRTFRRWK